MNDFPRRICCHTATIRKNLGNLRPLEKTGRTSKGDIILVFQVCQYDFYEHQNFTMVTTLIG